MLGLNDEYFYALNCHKHPKSNPQSTNTGSCSEVSQKNVPTMTKTYIYVPCSITESVPPGKPLFIQTKTFAREMIVSWAPPDGDVLIRGYRLGYGTIAPDEEWVNDIPPSSRIYTLRQLSKNLSGHEIIQYLFFIVLFEQSYSLILWFVGATGAMNYVTSSYSCNGSPP